MKRNVDLLSQFLEVQYAPLDWKKDHLGWDLQVETQRMKQKIDLQTQLSVKDFHGVLREFFQSLRDYHTTIQFTNSQAATLPFTTKGSHGKYFICTINRGQLPYSMYPIEIGDELVCFDSKLPQEAIVEFNGKDPLEDTEQAVSEFFLTNRFGSLGYKVPQGSLKISIKSKKTEKLTTYQLEWEQSNQKVSFFETLSAETFIPLLGDKEWHSNAFNAYLFQTEAGLKAGYIRLADYRGGLHEIEELAKIIQFFEEHSDVLVIDQVNNSGGSLFYMMAVASMFGIPLQMPFERVTVSQDDASFAVNLIPSLRKVKTDQDARKLLGTHLSGYPVTLSLAASFIDYQQLILDTWSDNQYMTKPFYLYGIEHVIPHSEVSYTKPVLVLVNELSFSCADFFPALMQDNDRATIMGNKTAGAGGLIAEASFPNRLGIDFYTYTASLIVRRDGNPLENLGVIPDIPYQITHEDLQYDYKNYKIAIIQALEHL